MATLNDIRAAFLENFRAEGHEVVPSSPLVPYNDPTLLFANSGMVQFKDIFTGRQKAPHPCAATAQKCLRAGGKHNDLDNVGYTSRHHTFFEMLGNFSFGDYFKERAIPLAWQLVTGEFGLPADRLLVTVYAEDDEAARLWRQVSGLPESRILRIATSDNFWTMGPTGPCGPCSEIFFDHGEGIPGGPPGSPDEDGDRFVEIWNLVFMQFEQFADGRREGLPRPSIDTGMGLERIGAVLQGTSDNYETDLFRALIEASADLASGDPDGPGRVHHRVIADHLRAACFLIADDVLPANEGRGYVLRRILRRAMRHAQLLGVEEPMLWRLAAVLGRKMGQAFPELDATRAVAEETLLREETRFRETLSRGLGLLESEAARLGDGEALPGEVAFRLFDTYGFPLDLTQDALREQGRKVDLAGFEAAMAEQRARSRRGRPAGSGEDANAALWMAIAEEIGGTEFLGYQRTDVEGRVLALVRKGASVKAVGPGDDEVGVLVNQTPFYPESGGQQGDIGRILADGVRCEVTDARRKGELILHVCRMGEGELRVGADVRLCVDAGRRALLCANHSATHLLHEALREHLGDNVAQRGSRVAPDGLRFDFSHPEAVEESRIEEIERTVNRHVRANRPVETRVMSRDEAASLGARALFGEKYGDEVRVVSMGGREDGSAWSVELCGGTHVGRAGEIGLFRLVGQEAVAAGVRRVEARTGAAALEWVQARERTLREAADGLRVSPEELPGRAAGLAAERRRLEDEVARLRRKLVSASGKEDARLVEGVPFWARSLTGVPARDLRGLVDERRKEMPSGVVALVAECDGKAGVAVGVSAEFAGRVSAVDLVRVAAQALGGTGGGGRPDLAQGGGPNPAAAEDALRAVEEQLRIEAGKGRSDSA